MMPVVARNYVEDIPLEALKPEDRYLLVSDKNDRSVDLEDILKGAGEVVNVAVPDLRAATGDYFRIVIDIDLANIETVRTLRRQFDNSRLKAIPRYFVTATTGHHERTQAWALGAAQILPRPLRDEDLLRRIVTDATTVFHQEVSNSAAPVYAGVAAAHAVLMRMFDGLRAGNGLTLADVIEQETPIITALQTAGLRSWLDVVSRHHNHSYRHCLSVTGFTIAFAQHLGFGEADQRRMARSALLHDVGKAFVPLALLDKPGRLSEVEMSEMRRHADLGHDALTLQGGFSQETLDVVLHHHELLDGSGYPKRLKGDQISDIVRMVTITDIYSALVEERAYRSGMSREEAYGILRGMGGKLDQDFVRAFRYVALGRH